MPGSPYADASYINLETFKRDGTGVRTPVWCAPLGDEIVIFSEAKAGKVKRLRNDARIRVACCNVWGRVQGQWRHGSGRIVDSPTQEAEAYRALRDKYGWQMRLLDFASTRSGRIHGRAVLLLTLDSG